MKAINKRTLVLTSIVILLPMLFGLALWNKLPEEVPTHFDFSGTPDGYSGRLFAVVGLPLFILACHLFSAVVTRADPKKQNISEKLMNIVLWICPIVSLYGSAMVYSYALGYAINAARAGTFLVGICSLSSAIICPNAARAIPSASSSRGRSMMRITGIIPIVSPAVSG